MKRVLYSVAAVLIMAVVFTGCGDSGSNGSGVLQTDEYGVYEDGKCIAMAEELDTPFIFENEMQYDYKGRELSTKRGIKIGSTVRELVDAYKECIFWHPANDGGDFISASEYIDSLAEYKEAEADALVFFTYDVNGKLYSHQDFRALADENGGRDAMYESGDYIVKHYKIDFLIEDNIIESIMIGYNPDSLVPWKK